MVKTRPRLKNQIRKTRGLTPVIKMKPKHEFLNSTNIDGNDVANKDVYANNGAW